MLVQALASVVAMMHHNGKTTAMCYSCFAIYKASKVVCFLLAAFSCVDSCISTFSTGIQCFFNCVADAFLFSCSPSSGSFFEVLTSAGLIWSGLMWSASDHSSAATAVGYGYAGNPATLRLQLSSALDHDPAARNAFQSGFADFLNAGTENLQRALLPLTDTKGTASAAGEYYVVRDSLVKVLLKCDCIQVCAVVLTDLSPFMQHVLVEQQVRTLLQKQHVMHDNNSIFLCAYSYVRIQLHCSSCYCRA
jgi:hypothetical protein